MPLARTTISIEKKTLERFYKSYPEGMRSKAIQTLIEQDLDAKDEELMKAVELVETHSAFAQIHADSVLWQNATALHGLEDL